MSDGPVDRSGHFAPVVGPLVVDGVLEMPEDGGVPRVRVAGEWWTWLELGEALAETMGGGRDIALNLAGVGADHSTLDPQTADSSRRLFSPAGSETLDGRAGLAELDDGLRTELVEAVALLSDCLPPADRRPRADQELADATARIRAEAAAGGTLWAVVSAAAGWVDRPPDDDDELWLTCALCLATPGRPSTPLDPELDQCLESMDLDDWLAPILEVTRAGPGTPVDPESLLALSARCMDVDCGAVEPQGAAVMLLAFQVIVPVWRAIGAIDDDGLLTALGAWGLAPALARAWGGQLESVPPGQVESARSGQVEPARRGEVEPARSGQVEPARPGEVEPARPGEVEPARPGGGAGPAPVRAGTAPGVGPADIRP